MPAESAESPLEAVGGRWELASRARARAVLDRHARRITAAERAYYAEGIDSTSRYDLVRLRRRLHDRLFRAFSRSAPGSPVDFRFADPGSGMEDAGPYNDRAVLAETLRRTAAVDPGWVAELVELAGNAERLRRMLANPAPTTR